jgi:hypothetical protein
VERADETEANRRLTAVTGAVLLPLLIAECATAFRIRQLLPPHLFLGLLQAPPVALKLGTTGYRFARYVLGDARYRRAGPPRPAHRLLGLVLGAATLALFVSGVELWLFGYRFGIGWLTLHEAGFLVWFFAAGAHVLARREAAWRLTTADLARGEARPPGAITRRSLVAASVAVGLLLALVSLPWWSPFGLFES